MDINQQFLLLIKNDDTEALEKYYFQSNWWETINFEWLYPQLGEYDNGNSLNLIGYLYKKGIYLKRDDEKAFRFYQDSAKRGNVFALNNLGLMYSRGEYIERNYSLASQHYLKSAKKGHIFALNNLVHLYYDNCWLELSEEVKNDPQLNECGFNAILRGLMNDAQTRIAFPNDEFLKQKYLEQEAEIKLLKEKVEALETELKCIPEYGEAYQEAKRHFEVNQ